KRFDELTYTTALNRDLKVMDAAAISLCRENKVPILVFNLTQPGSIIKAIQGEPIGTIVRGE
ncbi:MAG: UMP kinase, partial [bacterium]|nr:UMP kinase [bacterium]